MTAVQRIFWAHLTIATAATAVGYALAGSLAAAAAFVFIGALWLLAQFRYFRGFQGILLGLFALGAVPALRSDAPAALILVGVTAALGAWDLDHFLLRLAQADHVEYATGLGRVHLRRLLIVESLGLTAGLLAITIRAEIGFWPVVLLVLLAVFGLSRLITYVRRQTES